MRLRRMRRKVRMKAKWRIWNKKIREEKEEYFFFCDHVMRNFVLKNDFIAISLYTKLQKNCWYKIFMSRCLTYCLYRLLCRCKKFLIFHDYDDVIVASNSIVHWLTRDWTKENVWRSLLLWQRRSIIIMKYQLS